MKAQSRHFRSDEPSETVLASTNLSTDNETLKNIATQLLNNNSKLLAQKLPDIVSENATVENISVSPSGVFDLTLKNPNQNNNIVNIKINPDLTNITANLNRLTTVITSSIIELPLNMANKRIA